MQLPAHILTHARLSMFAAAIEAKGIIYGGANFLMPQNIIMFLDGCFRTSCRPKRGQRFTYNGNKKKHGLQSQAATGPDGMCYDW